MSKWAASVTKALQPARLQQRSHSASSMSVQPLFLGRHFAERLPRSGNEKNGVVREACLAAPLGHDLASALALEELRRLLRRGQGHDANESRCPWPWRAFQALQELGRPFHLRWRKACGVQSWKATERVDLHPRVVSQRRELGPAARRLGFQSGVLGVALTHLVDLGVEGDELESRARQQLSIFAQLAGVAGSDDQPLSQALLSRVSGPRS